MTNHSTRMIRRILPLLLFLVSFPALAGERVLLTIEGALKDQQEVAFTRSDLEAIEMVEVATGTPWHDGVVQFEGVPLKSLMHHVGAAGSELHVSALNDYTASIPMRDVENLGPILALKKDGSYMGIEDKGPLFVIYPYDGNAELQSEIYYSRSVWQARKIIVK